MNICMADIKDVVLNKEAHEKWVTVNIDDGSTMLAKITIICNRCFISNNGVPYSDIHAVVLHKHAIDICRCMEGTVLKTMYNSIPEVCLVDYMIGAYLSTRHSLDLCCTSRHRKTMRVRETDIFY